MRTTKHKLIVTGVAAAVILAGVQIAHGFGPDASRHGRHGGGPGQMQGGLLAAVGALDLSPDQVNQVRDLLREHRQDVRRQVDALIDARKTLLAAVVSTDLNLDAIRAAHAEVATAEVELAVTKATLLQAAREILDDTQQATAAELLQDSVVAAERRVNGIRWFIDRWLDQPERN